MSPEAIALSGTIAMIVIAALGVAAQWGSQRTFSRAVKEKVDEEKQAREAHEAHTEERFGDVWKRVNNHGERIGYLEGKANGRSQPII
jgi:hypothetical protein